MKSLNVKAALGLIIALLCAAYMVQWISMPLYADEVADRLKAARLFHDGGTQYGLYGVCIANIKTIPFFFYPAASVFALLDAVPLYLVVRALPLLVLVFALIVFFRYGLKQKIETGALLLLGGFIGVAGSSLVMARPEFSLLFIGSCCLWIYGLLRETKMQPRTAATALLLLLFAFQIVVFHHVQSLIYLPLVLLLCFRLTQRLPKLSSISFAAASVFIAYAAYLSVVTSSVVCPEWPMIEARRASMTFLGRLHAPDSPGLLALLSQSLDPKLVWQPLIFFKSYAVHYLPGIPDEAAGVFTKLVSQMVRFFALLNIAALIIMAFAAPLLWLRDAFKKPDWKKLLSSPKLFVTLIAAPYVLLCLYDQQHGFYRVFHVNLIAAMLLAVVCSHGFFIKSAIAKKAVFVVGCFAAFTCISSTLLSAHFFSPQLFTRQASSDVVIPFALDWRARNEAIDKVAHACGITDETQNIIVDNTTYDALKQHHHLIHSDYLFLGDRHDRPLPASQVKKKTHADAMLTQCSRFPPLKLHPQASEGLKNPNPLLSYCCARF